MRQRGQPFWDKADGAGGTGGELDEKAAAGQPPADGDSFTIDHFLPWSFVVHDLLCNLTPGESTTNSSKNDVLPEFCLRYQQADAANPKSFGLP